MVCTYLRRYLIFLAACAISLGASAQTSFAVTLLILGDSLAEGYGVEKSQAWPALLERDLGQNKAFLSGIPQSSPSRTAGMPSKSAKDQDTYIPKPNGESTFRVINAGVSGSTSASGPGRLKWHLKMLPDIDWLLIELGANDGLRGQDVQAMEKNLGAIIEQAKSAKIAKIFLADMKVPSNYGKQYSTNFESAFSRVAKRHKITLVPFLLADVAGKKEFNLPDGIHPNQQGHVLVANTMKQFFLRQFTGKP